MGNSYSSRINLSNDCTSFEAGETGTTARWGDSLKVSTSNRKEDDDHTELWGVEYKTGKKLEHSCGFQLSATHDDYGVERVHYGLSDSADNKTGFSLDITRVGRDGLRGGIKGIESSGACRSYIITKQDYSIETTVVSYDCSYRDGLFVLQMKKMNYSDHAFMVTMAHYYVTKAVGLYVEAQIYHRKGKGFAVEVKGPLKYPSADLRVKIEETRRRCGIWSPGASSKSEVDTSQNVKHASNHGNRNQNSFNTNVYQQWYNIFSSERNRYHTSNNYGGRLINNSGTFNGNNNGGYREGGFDASTTYYNY